MWGRIVSGSGFATRPQVENLHRKLALCRIREKQSGIALRACATIVARTLLFAASRFISTRATVNHNYLGMLCPRPPAQTESHCAERVPRRY